MGPEIQSPSLQTRTETHPQGTSLAQHQREALALPMFVDMLESIISW